MYNSMSMPEFDELHRKKKKINILDVRESDEFRRGHIPGAQSVPLSHFPVELEKEQSYYIVCQSGSRSAVAAQYLAAQGHDVTNLIGGMSTWRGDIE